MRNICVITGAPCFGMHKVVQFLDERGVSLINLQGASGKRTEKEEDIVLRYTAEDETNIVLTREDIKHRVLVLTTEQTELLMQSVKTSSGSRAGNKLNTYLCMHLAAASIFLSVILILNQELRKPGLSARMANMQCSFCWKNV